MPTEESAWRSASLVLVFPAEPVTAMIFALVRARAAAPAFSSAASTSGTTIIGAVSRPSAGSLPSAMTSRLAPALTAAVAKSWPSMTSPLMAKKASPGTRLRVSIDMPVTACGIAPIGLPPIASISSSASQSELISTRSRSALRTSSWSENGKVYVADRLAFLVALAGDDQRVAGVKGRNRLADRLVAVADLDGAGRGGEDRLADFGRYFGARIVVGDDDEVGEPGGDLAHDRALAAVAVAAAAEDDDDAAGGEGPDRGEHVFQRVRLVRVVDIDRRAVLSRAGKVEPAGRALEMLERGERLGDRRAGGGGEAGGDQRVEYLEVAGERQVDLVQFAAGDDLGALAETLVLDALQRQEVAMAADGEHIEAGGLRRVDRRLRPVVVGEDDGRRALRQQRVEEAQLGAKIVLDRRMIVHVVAAEIGEAAGGEPDAVEPALVEAVAGGFHRGVGDAGIGEFGEQLVKLDRVGRGERAVVVAAGRDDAGGADAGGGDGRPAPRSGA